MSEIWKNIKDYPNYQISNLGNVKSSYYNRELILRPVVNNHGYLVVSLCNDNDKKIKLISRLVAETFIPNPDNKPEVDHINNLEKTNNTLSNLRWATHTENIHNTRVHKNNKLGHKHIYIKPNGSFRVEISRETLRYAKTFKTLEEAIQARDDFLNTYE